jgi:ribonuclease-3
MSTAEVGGHTFQDPQLLDLALTHSSLFGADKYSNERMEFLGDAVLSMCVSESLHARQPALDEGTMTRARALVVNTRALAEHARRLQLDQRLKVGRMFEGCAQYTDAMLADVFEAVLAAIYLDAGLAAARAFVQRHLCSAMDAAVQAPDAADWKSTLHRRAQADGLGTVTYELVSTAGPDHERTFEVLVRRGERTFPSGFGRSRKEAEQRAARLALQILGDL